MNKEKLNDVMCESSSDYDILNDAYNYIEYLEQQCKKQKEIIAKAEKILNECKLLMPHEFDWKEQVDNALDILKEVSE